MDNNDDDHDNGDGLYLKFPWVYHFYIYDWKNQQTWNLFVQFSNKNVLSQGMGDKIKCYMSLIAYIYNHIYICKNKYIRTYSHIYIYIYIPIHFNMSCILRN